MAVTGRLAARMLERTALLGTRQIDPLAITDGEVNFLRSFIQGSIMDAGTWDRLMRGWGFCQRHAWVALAVEMSFRRRYLLGPTILYTSLAEQGGAALQPGLLHDRRMLAWRLKTRGPCVVCDAAIQGGGALRRTTLEQGKDPDRLRGFACELQPHWRHHVCRHCVDGLEGSFVCREHLRDEFAAGEPVDVAMQRSMLTALARRLANYQRSFTFEYRGTDTPEDRASLLSVVGWCAGWRPLIELLDTSKPNRDETSGGRACGG